LVGEMRDLETIEAAMTIAETGHLVFATLHTNSAVQSLNRVIDVFPPHQQEQIRAQLSFVLQAVITQMLLPRSDGPGRCLAAEVMIPNYAIRNLIRENKVHQIYGLMQTGQGLSGMQTMNQALYRLLSQGVLSTDEAVGRSPEPTELQSMIEKRSPVTGGQRRQR
ncbi:MAG: ATPase, T2SS/T4P/T4SS family, partial [Myxococcota bacterium]